MPTSRRRVGQAGAVEVEHGETVVVHDDLTGPERPVAEHEPGLARRPVTQTIQHPTQRERRRRVGMPCCPQVCRDLAEGVGDAAIPRRGVRSRDGPMDVGQQATESSGETEPVTNG